MAGFLSLSIGTWRHAQAHDIALFAASVAYFGLLALFPAIATVVAAYGVFGEPGTVRDHIDALQRFAPADVARLAQEQLTRLVQADTGALAISGLVTTGLAVWGASRGTDAFIKALDRVEGGQSRRGLLGEILLSLWLTGAGALTALALIALLAAAPAALAFAPLGAAASLALDVARFALALAAAAAYAAALYRWGPCRARMRWGDIWVGAIGATVVWAAASAALGHYVERFAAMSETYGSIAGVAVLILWLYVSAYVFLLGGVLASQLSARERRRRHRRVLKYPFKTAE